MKFLDEAIITIRSGKGGDGCLSFHREKFVEFGGPDGGNGGKGGDVIFTCTNNLNTLIDYRYQQIFKAQNGQPGSGRNKAGKGGTNVTIPLPPGTEIISVETDEVLADLTEIDQTITVLEGGRGGRGNATFKTSTNQAPRQITKGQPAQELEVILRLKLLADVGLLGLPNAGKSTFISAVSNAKPKIADYPFTTLKPNLGMVRHQGIDMVIADLPGLIAGAAQGTGLGHQFLKHTSRCSALLHLIDITSEDPAASYKTIRKELAEYDEEFGTNIKDLPEVVALNKADSLPPEETEKALKEFKLATKTKPIAISAVSKQGVEVALSQLATSVKSARPLSQPAPAEEE